MENLISGTKIPMPKYFIGDIVKVNDKYCTILFVVMIPTALIHDYVYYIFFLGGGFDSCRTKDISPIEINADILSFNGWKYNPYNKSYYKMLTKGSLVMCIGVKFEKDNNILDIDDVKIMEIRYIHQLQHFLTGLGFDSNIKIENDENNKDKKDNV